MQAKAKIQPFLLFLAFLSGMSVMLAEMAGARALCPFFGSSTYIWANVIGCLMAAMALGYYAGGRLADRKPSLLFLLSLVGSAGAFAAFVPVVLHPLAGACVPEGIGAEHSFRINVLGSLFVTVLLLAPLVFLLGMVPPFLVRLLTKDVREAGSSAGRVNAFGAVGSIFGTFLPTLILVPALGTRLTFTVAGGLLVGTAAAGTAWWGSGRRRKWSWLWLLPVLPSLMVASLPVHPGPETLAERESPYQYIRVYEREGKRYLTLNEGRDQYHSLLVEGKVLTEGNYYDYLNLVPLHFDPALRRRLRVCVVGLAAGIYSRQIHHFFGSWYDVEVDGAEIDPDVLEARWTPTAGSSTSPST
jgi:MFS family permease